MKTYALTLSRHFPTTHARKGEPTWFIEKIKAREKIHTIRGNYPFWEERFKKIKRHEAFLSLRYWEGEPYRSEQVEFMRLFHEHEIGIQKMELFTDGDGVARLKDFTIGGRHMSIEEVSMNDGLSKEDFREWFKNYDLTEPMAIIHFTGFRY